MTCQNSPANPRVLPSRRNRLIRLQPNGGPLSSPLVSTVRSLVVPTLRFANPLPGSERGRDHAGGRFRSRTSLAISGTLDPRTIEDIVVVMAAELKRSNADRDKALSDTVAILMEKHGQSTKVLVESA